MAADCWPSRPTVTRTNGARPDLTQQNLVATRFVTTCRTQRFCQEAGNEIEFHRITRAALEHRAMNETGPGEE